MHISPIRTANGATVAEVAKHSSLSPMTVAAVEKGNGSIRSTLKVLDALGAEISWKGKRDLPVGVALALRRKEAAISQRRIAQLIGVTQPTIIALEVRNSGRMPAEGLLICQKFSKKPSVLCALAAFASILAPAHAHTSGYLGEKFWGLIHAGS